MKNYNIIVDFKGSQTGNSEPEHFKKGDVAALSDHLAEVALQYGYVEHANADELETKPAKAALETKPAKAKK